MIVIALVADDTHINNIDRYINGSQNINSYSRFNNGPKKQTKHFIIIIKKK